MLDREDIIVTVHAQRGNELFPPTVGMAVAAGTENPGAVAFIRVLLGIEHARFGQIEIVDLRVLRMYVKNCIAQYAYCLDGIDLLPEHMARIVIASYARTCNRAQLQHCLRAVHDKSRMHLDRDFDSMVLREFAVLFPERRHLLLPLPV